MTAILTRTPTNPAVVSRRPAGEPPRDGRRGDPELPLVRHAIGLKLAIELGELDEARVEVHALFAALAAAETTIGVLAVKARAKAKARARATRAARMPLAGGEPTP